MEVTVEQRQPNPYRERLTEFPGRLFTFTDFEHDRKLVCERSKGKQIICELCSGSGGHLLDLAERAPETQFYGFELRFKRSVRTIEKGEKRGISNVFLLRTNARNAPLIFPPNSISGVYINFPDPWEKRRGEKHRLFDSKFLTEWYSLLIPGGFISVKTDHHEYFETLLTLVRAGTLFRIEEMTHNLYESNFLQANISTEFERMFRDKGNAICYLKLIAG